jgi:hypothetical protein
MNNWAKMTFKEFFRIQKTKRCQISQSHIEHLMNVKRVGIMFRIVFWDVLPCKIVVDRRFRGAYCLHHQGWVGIIVISVDDKHFSDVISSYWHWLVYLPKISRFDPRRRRKDFFSILCVQTSSGAHPASCTMGNGGPFPGAKARPIRNVNHSPHPVRRSRMSRSYTSSPLKRLRGV